jgi:hypothetical protein
MVDFYSTNGRYFPDGGFQEQHLWHMSYVAVETTIIQKSIKASRFMAK